MHPEAKKGVQKMQIHARQAKLDLGGILGTIMNSMGGITGIFQTGMSILQNLFGGKYFPKTDLWIYKQVH